MSTRTTAPTTVANPLRRNVAIIAHVDHGKTTLVDAMFRQAGVFRANERVAERAMDSNELERERGITILAKNTAVHYGDTLINIVDTPGHADFGGEVERVLSMVDGVVLLVDAAEGPAAADPLRAAQGVRARPAADRRHQQDRSRRRAGEGSAERGLRPLHRSRRHRRADRVPGALHQRPRRHGEQSISTCPGEDLRPLFDAILEHVPPPRGDVKAPLQMLVANLDCERLPGPHRDRPHLQRQGASSTIRSSSASSTARRRRRKVTKLFTFEGLKRVEIEEATAGDIVCLAGIEDITIGETIADPEHRMAIPPIAVDEPTVSMIFGINTSPMAGRDGQYVTSRHLKERLDKELLGNVSLRVEPTDTPEQFKVLGRGELQLAILIEMMRREGFELQVSRPEIVVKEIDGVRMEPVEDLVIDVAEDFQGVVISTCGTRRGTMTSMVNHGSGRVRMEFRIPARGLIGFRSQFLTETKGTGIMNHLFAGWEPWHGPIPSRATGALVSDRAGVATAYALANLQERGVDPHRARRRTVYEGMMIGENSRDNDLDVNVSKEKKQTNMRASSADEAIRLVPPHIMGLEQAIEFINDDELVEVTPKTIRLRKRVLAANMRPRKEE